MMHLESSIKRLHGILHGRRLSKGDVRRICAWCKRVLDGKGPVKPGEVISHGICKACADKVVRGSKKEW